MSAPKYVAMLNNLGGATALEMSVLAEALRTSKIGDKISHIVGPSWMMSALDMHGFSVSLYPLSEEDEALLAAPSAVTAWPPLRKLFNPSVVSMPDGEIRPDPLPSPHPAHAAYVSTCCNALIDAEADLNLLDAKSGDGDTGTTAATAARALLERLDHLPLADLTQLFPAISKELSQTMGGSSGVLLAIYFSAVGEAFASGSRPSSAFRAGLKRISEVGGAQLGDRTMIDSLSPALECMDAGLPEAALAARAGANATAKMSKANAGRSSYVSAKQLKGNIDPGAEAVARLFEALVPA